MRMNLRQKIQARFHALFGQRKLDLEMDEEMRAHIEMRTQANIDGGMDSAEARRAALREFGWAESVKEICRDQRGVRWIEDLVQDVRYGARMLAKNPSFTAIAVVALGIAAAKCSSQFLYRVPALDSATFVIIPLALLTVAMIACWLPARRAAKADPMVALRHE